MEPENTLRKASIGNRLRIITRTKYPRFSIKYYDKRGLGYCFVCGQDKTFIFTEIIDDHLAKTWSLDSKLRDYYDIRESTVCDNCKSSLRSNVHARAILKVFAPNSKSLKAAIGAKEFDKLEIAEINSCGALHNTLKEISSLSYSEFAPQNAKTVQQDITKLTYDDDKFDLVLTSETLEHVPEWEKALSEVHRVLKPGGYHIFTVPLILNRKTRNRARMVDGKLVNILEKSFHGCARNITSDDYVVCNEFGADIINTLENLIFETRLYFTNVFNLRDPNVAIVSKKK